jgi:hypothetical protein
MMKLYRITPGRVSCIVFALAVLAVSAVGTPRAVAAEDYAKLPGYVDFETMGIFGDTESTIEVFLKGPLLKMVTEAVKSDDPELAVLLSGLKLIRVQVFPMDPERSRSVAKKTDEMAKQLEKKGWEMAVRVREDEEHVYLYLLPGKDATVAGLVVMAIEDDGEAAFVNIIGDIDPAQIGRIGRTFHIDSLEIPIEIRDDSKTKRRHRRQ